MQRDEEVLERVPQVWRAVFDAAHNGIMIVNRQGRIVVYNRAARRMLGGVGQRIVGRHFKEVRPEAWADIKKILTTATPQLGKPVSFPNATIVANRSPIIMNGEVVGVISVFQDISAYEAMVEELKGYKRLLREMEAIFESSSDGLYITDGQANTIRVNTAYERITGLNREELVGRNMHELVARGFFDQSVTLEVLRTGRQVTIMQSIKGGEKQVMVTGTPFFDEDGEIELVVTNVRDMTMLKRLEAELERSKRVSSRYYQSLMEHQKYEYALEEMVVRSRAMSQVVRKAVKVSGVDAAVLIHGESGVGKSLLARLIHQMSPRKDRPFVKINCGAIPASLMESELFGYTEGAFTGAAKGGKAGLIEAAHTGTVFLDEVGELTPAMQVKLLEVIEEKTFTRVGDTRPTKVDVRIIAATNRDLKKLIARGRFREDLYFRLNVIPIHIPPLRERREDIPALAMRMLESFNRRMGTSKRLAPEVMDRLVSYDYPGNVRELINLLERMVVMSEGEVITLEDLPGELREQEVGEELGKGGMTLKAAVEALERRMIAQALERWGSPRRAAMELGVHPSTLWRKMVRYGLSTPIAQTQRNCISATKH